MLAALPTSLEIGGWLLCLVAVFGGVNQVLKVLDRLKEYPTPRDTYAPKGDYAARGELKELAKRLDDLAGEFREADAALRGEIKHDRELANGAAEARADKLHSRIDEVLAAVSELRGRVDAGRFVRK